MDQYVLMVAPVDAPLMLPGSTLITADCGHHAWVSRSGLPLVLTGEVITRCWHCVDPTQVTQATPVGGAAEELRALFGAAVAEEMIAPVRDGNPATVIRALQRNNPRRRRS
jgi:hypothetical protein